MTSDLAVIIMLLGAVTTFVWIYIGWRAMEAYERLASAAEEIARKVRDRDEPKEE